jgi:hypothetical protein
MISLSMINTLLAGVGGALGSILTRSFCLHFINKYDFSLMDEMSYDQPWKKKNQETLKKKTYFMNIYATLDPFLI